jgi:MoaA/NifB/PqqE/SkfB family radical SAM enzyme
MDLTSRCNLRCVMCHFSVVDQIDFQPFDRRLAADGSMPVDVFERIAADLFPRASRVALGCAAEPLLHPRFTEIVAIAGGYDVADLWFPTNLLPLTPSKAEAICAARVHTLAASIDAFSQERYEAIRVGGNWKQLIGRLDLFNEKRSASRHRPRLRIIFTWMRSNRAELGQLPAFAEKHGADEIDVRWVVPAPRVDNATESLDGEERVSLYRELRGAAEEAVDRGLTLSSYPELELLAPTHRSIPERLARRMWRLRAGLDRRESWEFALRERLHGCAYPGRTYVVRPNGAVSPCVFWNGDPIGFYPEEDLATFAAGPRLREIRDGLASDRPVGSCQGCTVRRRAFHVLARS